MSQKLQDYVQEYGGKHGSLLYFRENVEGGVDRVLPFEILTPGEQFGLSARRKVWAACKDYQTDKVIVRTSEQSDWAGMVDTMPTMVTEQSFFGVRDVVSEIRRKCHDPRILEYARKEGNGYDPNRVTVSVAPYLNPELHPRTLVTQHPNNPNARMVDISTPYELHNNWFRHEALDFDRSGRLLYAYSSENPKPYADDALRLGRWLEEAGELPESQAFQFEGAVFQARGSSHTGPKLFQIRHFAEKRLADFQVPRDNHDNLKLVRNFGVTPKDGIQLRVAPVSDRSEFSSFEARNPGVPYLLSVRGTSNPLKITDQPTSMQGYFPLDFKPSLSHQATRMVQITLSHPHGVASLITLGASEKLRAGEVRIVSDGIRQRIQEV